MFQSIELENLLSFKHVELELKPLNVLIGANASGKSNLIRAFGLLRALPKDMSAEIAEGGGVRGWVNQKTRGTALLVVSFNSHSFSLYDISFRETGQSYEIVKENCDHVFKREGAFSGKITPLNRMSLTRSILSEGRQQRDIASLSESLEEMRLYREFRTGPGSLARIGVSASGFGEYLSEDGGNLAAVLSKMKLLGLEQRVNASLTRLFEDFSEIFAYPSGGIIQIYVREKGMSTPVSGLGLSDGTLRWLCLLAVLLDPEPAPLVCLEEPEAGLHPDAIRMVAELLVEASSRTQLIVTTHSPALVDALGSQPESVVVCERDFDGFTELKRLKSADLDEWLARYSLGQLWQKGEIGGNRW